MLLMQQYETMSNGAGSLTFVGQKGLFRSMGEALLSPKSGRAGAEYSRFFTSSTILLNTEDDPIDLDKPQVREVGSPKIRALAEEIVNMSLLDMADLTEILQERLKLPPLQAGMGMFGGGGGGAPMQAVAAEGEAPGGGGAAKSAEEKTEFDLKLASYDKATKIKVIKEIRAITELGLKEAKELVESTPAIIKKSLSKAECEELIAKLKEVGAEVVME